MQKGRTIGQRVHTSLSIVLVAMRVSALIFKSTKVLRVMEETTHRVYVLISEFFILPVFRHVAVLCSSLPRAPITMRGYAVAFS
jgi:hypothetical protein